jgi:hypothetical protein
MDTHDFSAGTVQRKGNIIIIRFIKDTEVTAADMREIRAIREDLFGDNNYASLIDLRYKNLSFTKEAKEHVTENETIRKFRIAEVLLVKSFIEKLGVHSYVKIFRSKDLVTVMTKEDNAIHWLNTQFDKHNNHTTQ